MKKFVFVMLSVLLIASMCFTFTGCTDKESKIVGTWKGTETCDLNKAMENMSEDEASMAELLEYMDLGTYEINVTYTFNADGTCNMAVDKASSTLVIKELLDALMDGLEAYFTAMAESYSITVDQLAQASGYTSFDNLMESMNDQMKDRAAEMVKTKQEGTYTLEDNKLVITDTADEVFEATVVELTETSFKFTVEKAAAVIELTKSK